jgi:hypothetical protein
MPYTHNIMPYTDDVMLYTGECTPYTDDVMPYTDLCIESPLSALEVVGVEPGLPIVSTV